MKTQEILVVIHLSANAINTVIGQIFAPDDIRILGVSSVKSTNFYQGVIKHREKLKANIKQSIQEAEDMANCRVMSVWLSFSTPTLISYNAIGTVNIDEEKSTHQTVEARDVVAALTDAKRQHLSDSQYLMHYSQQGIILDDSNDMIDDAIGLTAEELSVMYHLMIMPVKERNELQQLLQECDVSIDQMIFDAVSSAEYGVLAEEKYHGVCFIDIGSGTTSVCVYSDDRLLYTHCFPEGSHDVTLDISYEMDITVAEAENLKKIHASVDKHGIDASQFISIKRNAHDDEKTINMQELYTVTEARYRSILNNVKTALIENGLIHFLHQGIVISGGGAEMRGLIPLAKQIFNQKVSKVNPHPAISAYTAFEDNDEKLKYLVSQITARQYQTAFGTLLYSQSDAFKYSEKSSPDSLREEPALKQKFQRISGFLKKFL